MCQRRTERESEREIETVYVVCAHVILSPADPFSRIHITESVSITIVISLGIRFECFGNCIYLCGSVRFGFISLVQLSLYSIFSAFWVVALFLAYQNWHWHTHCVTMVNNISFLVRYCQRTVKWNRQNRYFDYIYAQWEAEKERERWREWVCDWVKIHLKAS